MTRHKVAKTGNEAMAEVMRQINPGVVAAYPITPATEVVQIFSQFVADGAVDTEFIAVESEHSAMSATMAAAASGSRAMTVTSSQGLALMYEMLYIAAALRLPIVLPEVNRALSAPINIHCDHSDTMGARDAGWIQIFSENSQEAYDNIMQAVRISEHPDVLLPSMVTTDGFIISHCMETMEIFDDATVREYVGPYQPHASLLDLKNPHSLGALDLQDYYFEHRMQLAQAMRRSKDRIVEVGADFGKRFGRPYGLFESYRMEDAEAALILLGSTAGTAKMVVDAMRKEGHKVGLIKLRVFRPFPYAELAAVLGRVKAVAVMDRSDGLTSYGGPLFDHVRSTLYDLERKPRTVNYIYGLGGRDITLEDLRGIFVRLHGLAAGSPLGELITYHGVRA
ncbi:MAG: pyruvate ferredoxin oxidoreductase [candidate division NC10 bacterium]